MFIIHHNKQGKIWVKLPIYLYLNVFIGEGNGNPLQYSYLENPMDRGAWWAAVHRVAQSWTRLKLLNMHACTREGNGNPLQYSCLENPDLAAAEHAYMFAGTGATGNTISSMGGEGNSVKASGPVVKSRKPAHRFNSGLSLTVCSLESGFTSLGPGIFIHPRHVHWVPSRDEHTLPCCFSSQTSGFHGLSDAM